MPIGGHDHNHTPQQKFLQIKQNDKFFSKLLSKESSKSKAEASFRVLYYGGNSSSIPFMWESQPGTPKHPCSLSTLPPLTPPPSYQFSPKSQPTPKNPKPKFPFNIFNKSKKGYVAPSLSISSSCSFSSRSSCSAPVQPFGRRGCSFSPSRSRVDEFDDDDDEDDDEKEKGSSIFCFGGRSDGFSKEGSRSKLNMKFPL